MRALVRRRERDLGFLKVAQAEVRILLLEHGELVVLQELLNRVWRRLELIEHFLPRQLDAEIEIACRNEARSILIQEFVMGKRCRLTREEDRVHVEKSSPVPSVTESSRVFPFAGAEDGICIEVARQVKCAGCSVIRAGREVSIDESEGAVIHCDRSREAALTEKASASLLARCGRTVAAHFVPVHLIKACLERGKVDRFYRMARIASPPNHLVKLRSKASVESFTLQEKRRASWCTHADKFALGAISQE